MIDVRANSIIYQSQIYYRDLLNELVVKKKLGKALLDQWNKADLILGYLEALNYRNLLTDETDILNVNYILECLIKLCDLNQYPVSAPLTFQSPPAVIVGAQGDKGDKGDQGLRGYTGLATDFSLISTSITSVVDSFPITSAKAARWDYHVINTSNAQRAASVIGHWSADGSLTELIDTGAEDLGGDTSGIEFNVVYSASTIQLVAVVTSGTWSITGSRYFIPNNGNGSGPITNVLPLGRIYIGNASNQAQDFAVTGHVLLSTTGVTTIQPNVIDNSHIAISANIGLTKLASLNNNIVVITDGSGKLTSSTLNPTTLSYVDIGSSLTGLLNTKLTDPLTTIGDLLIRNNSNITARLGIGTNNQVLTVVGGLPVWQNVPGGISGLTTGFIPKASSATTLVNSIISETTGAVQIAGTLESQGGIRTEPSGIYYKKKTIGFYWNMNTTPLLAVNHGVTSGANKIKSISCIIYGNAGSTLAIGGITMTTINLEGINQITKKQMGSIVGYNNTQIELWADPTEQFGTLSIFSGVVYQRGELTIEYEA